MQWEYIPLNPAPGIKPPKSAPGRVWYLQPTELRAALEAAPICGYGYARGEILRLRWLDIDCKAGRVLLPQTKNGGGRIVYLNRLALQAIESVRAERAQRGRSVVSISSARMGERCVLACMPESKDCRLPLSRFATHSCLLAAHEEC